MELEMNYDLSKLNTFGIQARCRYFVEVTTVDQLQEVLKSDVAKENPLMILGGGSNLLITKDLEALVIKINIKGVEIVEENEDFAWVSGGAGEVWHEFVMKTLKMGCFGLENLSLIPGCVGASPMQNIGAYGVEIKDMFDHLKAVHITTGAIETFDAEACAFGYRESVFKRKLKGQYVICEVVFKLSKKAQLNTSYGAIEEELQKMGVSSPTPKDVSNAVIAIRQSKLPDPAKIGNSGSFFKNPVVSMDLYETIKKSHADVVGYPVDSESIKLAAGWLIERAGWKGKTIGNYGVHAKQALVLVNYGGATGAEIYQLSADIIDSVKRTFGVALEREVNIV